MRVVLALLPLILSVLCGQAKNRWFFASKYCLLTSEICTADSSCFHLVTKDCIHTLHFAKSVVMDMAAAAIPLFSYCLFRVLFGISVVNYVEIKVNNIQFLKNVTFLWHVISFTILVGKLEQSFHYLSWKHWLTVTRRRSVMLCGCFSDSLLRTTHIS